MKKAVSAYLDWWSSPQTQANLIGNGVELNEHQLPEIYSLLLEHSKNLSIPVPRLFAAYRNPLSPTGDFGYAAFTFGTQEKPIVFLSSSLIDAFPTNEVSFIIGHECGHIQNNHVVYHSIAGLLINNMPVLNKLAQPFTIPLMAWCRESEYTADLAGLLCCGNIETACKAMFRLTVGSDTLLNALDFTSFIEQKKLLESFHAKWNLVMGAMSHPYLVERIFQMISYFSENRARFPLSLKTPSASTRKLEKDLSSSNPEYELLFCKVCGLPLKDEKSCPYCNHED